MYELWTRSWLNQTHVNKIHGINNTTYYLSEKKNRHKNKIKYQLAWAYPSMEEYLEIKEIFTSLRSKILYLQNRNS